MRENLDFLIQSFRMFSALNPIWFIYLAALLYILFFTEKRGRLWFLLPLAIQLLTVFNPVFTGILTEKFGLAERFLRFFWMIPFFMTVGYAFVHLMWRVKKPVLQAGIGVLLTALIILVGSPVFPSDEPQLQYIKATNSGFTDAELYFLQHYFHAEGKENPYVLYDPYLIMRYRVLDPSVRSVISRNYLMNKLSRDLEGFLTNEEQEKYQTLFRVYYYQDLSIGPEEFRKAYDACHIDYLAVRAYPALEEFLMQGGFVMLGSTGTYEVWR